MIRIPLFQNTSKKLKEGYSLIETMLGVTLFTFIAGAVLVSATNLFKIEIRTKERVYKSSEKTTGIIGKFYFEDEYIKEEEE